MGLTLKSGEAGDSHLLSTQGVKCCFRSFNLRSFQWAQEVDFTTVPILHMKKLRIRD